MKCWVDGKECIYQSGENFGILNTATGVCNGCRHLFSGSGYAGMGGDIEAAFEEAGIEFDPDMGVFDRTSEELIFNNAKIILEALGLLEDQLKKSSSNEIRVKEKLAIISKLRVVLKY
jgi:hypothetical protein